MPPGTDKFNLPPTSSNKELLTIHCPVHQSFTSETKSRLVAELPDDVKYNQEWWERYCLDNDLDVMSGKSLRGSSYRDTISYEDLQDYLSF